MNTEKTEVIIFNSCETESIFNLYWERLGTVSNNVELYLAEQEISSQQRLSIRSLRRLYLLFCSMLEIRNCLLILYCIFTRRP